jgi:hypothetical protein
MNDVVTRVWQTDELQQIPALYGAPPRRSGR